MAVLAAPTALATTWYPHVPVALTAHLALRLPLLVPPASTRHQQDRVHVHLVRVGTISHPRAKRIVSAVLWGITVHLVRRLRSPVRLENTWHHLSNLFVLSVLLVLIAPHLD